MGNENPEVILRTIRVTVFDISPGDGMYVRVGRNKQGFLGMDVRLSVPPASRPISRTHFMGRDTI
jgi:hypothetical protein